MYTKCKTTNTKLLKSGLKLIGGKTKTRDIFYQYRPPEATTYIEPFLGSGNVWIGLQPFEQEFVSDINWRVINFFQTMRNVPNEVWDALQREVYMVQQFGKPYYYFLRSNEPEDAIANAAWFYAITKFGMNGIFRTNKEGKCNTPFCKTVDGRGIYTREWFDAVVKRIEHSAIVHHDYRMMLMSRDTPDAWAFIDPPYRACKTVYNAISFSDNDHIELRDILASLKCKWLLTINDDQFTRNLYKAFNVIQHDIAYSCSQTPAGRGKRPELIVMNY